MVKKSGLLLLALMFGVCLVAIKVMAIEECATNAECNADFHKSKCVDHVCVGCADNLNTGEESSDCMQFDRRFCTKRSVDSGAYCSDIRCNPYTPEAAKETCANQDNGSKVCIAGSEAKADIRCVVPECLTIGSTAGCEHISVNVECGVNNSIAPRATFVCCTAEKPRYYSADGTFFEASCEECIEDSHCGEGFYCDPYAHTCVGTGVPCDESTGCSDL